VHASQNPNITYNLSIGKGILSAETINGLVGCAKQDYTFAMGIYL
jgi:hypothetical protein